MVITIYNAIRIWTKNQEHPMRPCRLCQNPAHLVFEDTRPFFACNVCGLIFTDCCISVEAVEKHYKDQHSNTFDWMKEANSFTGWLKNLGHADPCLSLSILDYGSGSGLLTEAFRRIGFKVDCYEPMVHGEFNRESYSEAYGVIILNEVIEHLEDINKTLDIVDSVLAGNGFVFIKTLLTDQIINDPENFKESFTHWWYKDDPTHISFFSFLTIEYLCKDRGRNLMVRATSSTDNCVVLQKM
jgi:SAM-dependent methyltransferase